jgi:xylulokinase
MFQAVVDALAFEARLNLDQLETLDIDVHELRGVGGGSQARSILELKATVLNRPICTLKNPMAALLGTALLSQVATGQFSDLYAACREGVEIDQTIEPVAEAVERYAAAYERYRQLYGTLRSFYHNWRAECATTVTV